MRSMPFTGAKGLKERMPVRTLTDLVAGLRIEADQC